jgi:RNA polymerase sigma-70 factor (ECF subfamily)
VNLQQLFLIAKQNITEQDKAILSLYYVIELDVKIISKLFFKEEKAIYQRILRAKNHVKSKNNFQDISEKEKISSLHSILNIIYLIFTAGYNELETIEFSLCYEALRLGTLLTSESITNTSETISLIALMLFQSSRLDARIGENGEIITLEQQDFSKWDRTLINIGLYYLDQSENYLLSEYKLLARIAACYSISKSFDTIDWSFILKQYDTLIHIYPNPVYKLNRLVVVEKVSNAQKALEELQELKEVKALKNDYQLHLLEGNLYELQNKKDLAKSSFLNALEYTNNSKVRIFIQNKLNKLTK